MNRALSDYFRCPDEFTRLETDGTPSGANGFFRFGEEIVCYGQYSGGSTAKMLKHDLPDASRAVKGNEEKCDLPFDLLQVADNLRCERYSQHTNGSENGLGHGSTSRQLYYFLRPILPVPLRKHLQRIRLKGWKEIIFPHWPVDFTVDTLMERALSLVLKSDRLERIPFIWFWPSGAPGCAMMTHDVEALAGRDFCDRLMDLDDSFGIKSSFQIVPEGRYPSGTAFLDRMRRRDFEVNVHDLNHDGDLFREKREFLRRAAKINQYATDFHTRGFRSGAMYRNQEWYGAFDFSYDMSVPNVAHLEPQRARLLHGDAIFYREYSLSRPSPRSRTIRLLLILGDYSIKASEAAKPAYPPTRMDSLVS